jgi:hypothetical protein
MKKQIFFATIFTMTFLAIFTACKKEEEPAPNPNLDKALVALRSQQFILSSFHIAQRGADKADGLTDVKAEERNDTCGVVTVLPADPFAYPKIITVDFGTGCTDGDGKYKSGKVIITVGKVWEPNAELSLEYDNYKENGASLEGRFVLRNQSTPTAGVFGIQLQNVKSTDVNNNSVTYNASQTFTQIAGHPSWWDWSDDVYQITGDIDATLTSGESISWTINTPLVKANNCPWVGLGIGTLDLSGLPILVDYGNGNCDNVGTATINGVAYPITL